MRFFESLLFLSALNIEAAGKQSNAIVLGVIIAFIIVVVFAYVLLKFSTKLPIPQLFKISSMVMGLLAVVLAGKGIHSFQETGHIGIHGIRMFRIELLGIYPTIESCITQLIVLILVAALWKFSLRPKQKPVQV